MCKIKVNMFTVGPLETNCYVIYDDTTNEAVVVDPGLGCDAVLDFIAPFEVQHILLTHAHFDHIGGVAAMKRATGASVWIHEKERAWLADPTLNRSAYFLPVPITSPDPDRTWRGGETLSFLGVDVRILFTPGHSPGHVSLRWPQFVVSGDALFAGSIGRTDLPYGDQDTLLESIHNELLTLPGEMLLLPGHGPSTTVGTERDTNPFLNFAW